MHSWNKCAGRDSGIALQFQGERYCPSPPEHGRYSTMKSLRRTFQAVRKRFISVASFFALAMALFPGVFCYFVAVHRGDDLPPISDYFFLFAAWPWWLVRGVGLASEHPSYLTVAVVILVGWYLVLLSPSERVSKEP